MGSLCIFPLSSMESVFHFICGTTGSVVCLDCFTCVALVDSFLCTCTLDVAPIESVGGRSVVVSGTDVLIVQILFEVFGYVVKVCGHLIFGNSTYPIAFACALPSIISSVMLVTSNTVMGMLYYQHTGARHMSLDYAQTVHHIPQSVPWVDLEFLVIPDQVVVELCGLVGCYSLLLCQLHSQSERLEIPETVLPTVVWCVLCPCCACGVFWL